ncbi:hypothetical protein [Bifidobacterium castoris]|uniref:Uncharacterized protein n=1 Tax=Bifidobacterium castoris TaxID=2306972 RepID=A0A430F5U2_9BIFI|nr:hypothetical protein [Bifidobacterium castoris]RSX46488.1 hypothetical protein D2E22_1618 [Bifidobacterium castoris]
MARLYRSSYSRRCGKRRYPTRDDALPALDGSGLPVRAWGKAWLWRALRNRVERMERFVYEGVFGHVRPLTQTMARARRLDADDWATLRQTLPLARGFGEECNAWDSPARLWIVAAASV